MCLAKFVLCLGGDHVLKYSYTFGVNLLIYSQQPPATSNAVSPVPVTSSANEFHRVLPTAEVGRLAAHYAK